MVLVGLGCQGSFSPVDAAAEGDDQLLMVASDRYEFGEGLPGGVVAGQVEIRSKSTEIVSVKAFPTCGCTNVEPLEFDVEPGQTRLVRVGVQLPSSPNASRQSKISFQVQPNRGRRVECLVSAKCVGSVKADPPSAHFGLVSREELASAEKLLKLTDGRGLPIVHAGDLSAKCSLATTRTRIVIDESGNAALAIAISSDFSGVTYSDVVTLSLQGDPVSLPIQISASILESYRVVPSQSFLRKRAEGDLVAKFLVIAPGAATIDRIETLPGVEVSCETAAEGQRVRPVRITVPKHLVVPDRFETRIYLAGRDEPLKATLRKELGH
ncbi:MAG: hypothetical protein ACK5Q5_04605 [Planctomycetaceae bacterium]